MSVDRQAEPGQGQSRWRRWGGWALGIGVALALVAVWSLTPLRTYARVDAWAALGASIRHSSTAILWVLGAFVLASLVFIPITPLLAATALVFDPGAGLLYGLLAASLAAWVTHEIGRFLRRRRVRWLRGPRFEKLCVQLRRKGFATVLIARLLPFGSFTLFNIAAGAMEIRTAPYLLGNALGLLPRMLAFTLLADSLGKALRDPGPRSVAALVLGVLLSALAVFWLRRRAARARPSAAPE